MWEDEDMPIDENGVRAHAIMDGDSTIKRMNIGRMYEHYINRTSSMLSDRVRAIMETSPSDENVEHCWDMLTKYYGIVSPRMHAVLTGSDYRQTHRYHVDAVVREGIYLYLPTDNPVEGPEMIEQLKQAFPLNITPVRYRGRSGNVVTTVDKVLIGSLYVILLEKTGDDFSAVASAKLQHFGIPAKLTKGDRYANYARTQPVRLPGETEVRLMVAYMGPEATARLLEMSNNPRMHKNVVMNLLRAEQPTNIQEVVDDFEFPIRASRSQTYISHVLQCAGIEFSFKPYQVKGVNMTWHASSVNNK